MTTGEKIAKLRKECNYTQEQLAELLGVSRQSVSKYESGVAFPETEKLIKLSEIFGCSVDYLLKNNSDMGNDSFSNEDSAKAEDNFFKKVWNFEVKSQKTVMGMPLFHLARNAKGFFAVGLKAKGVMPFGLLAIGAIPFGLLSIGLLPFGMLSIGLGAFGLFAIGLVAAGSISAGILSFGAITVGIVSFGAVSVGEFALGALSIGHYFAYGDHAQAMFAFGDSEAQGIIFECINGVTTYDKQFIWRQMKEEIPWIYHWIVDIIAQFL